MPIEEAEDIAQRHSDYVQDIIVAVPPWILRWGTLVFLGILVMLTCLAALIRYPDVVNTGLKINSPNSPKPVIARLTGKLIKLMVVRNQEVIKGQPLAYLESTGNHERILRLRVVLLKIQEKVLHNEPLKNYELNEDSVLELGELQPAYQVFYGNYLSYLSTINNGFLIKKKEFLINDLRIFSKEHQELLNQKKIQEADLSLSEQQLQMHKQLLDGKVETQSEYRQEESKFLSKQSPLAQTESSLLGSKDNYITKQRELLEVQNEIDDNQSRFLQAINSLISTIDDWKSKYVLSASQTGTVSFAGIIQENETLTINQDVFYIDPKSEKFFGEMAIPQNSLGKVEVGQIVLIRLKSYPYEEYGMVRGTISYISDVPFKDSVFMSEVNLTSKALSDMRRPIHLKDGMTADAEIITQNATLFERLRRSFFKIEK